MTAEPALPAFARAAVNLASAGLGARVLSASDDFFAAADRMLADSAPVFIDGKFDDHGKWMDGWESRRRRDGGHDHAVVALAVRGRIDGFDVDTAHFTGNYPPACRIEACRSDGDPDAATEWVEVLGMRALGPDSHHFFACDSAEIWTHLRLRILPDGGVARLRVFGRPELDPASLTGGEIDLASALNGGRCLAYSDAHYGDFQRLLAPGRGRDMGDGWETRRRREPGNDWMIVALGARGTVTRALIDTAFFKGNFPDRCSIQGADLAGFDGDLTGAIVTASMFWDELLGERKLSADAIHEFGPGDIAAIGPITHVRLNIFPDGGVSRLRLFGALA